ncbi:MAG: VCBS repeat-containing protein, partial [Planctomycetales bacterium]|nr:VCBS repeat-containing protein [Planctomycetales bacterium]
MSIAKLLLRLTNGLRTAPVERANELCDKRENSSSQQPLRRWRRATEQLEERLALSTVTMTANEQLLVELINRARANPTAEMQNYAQMGLNDGLAAGTITPAAKEPLAPNQALTNAAGLHSQDMINRDFFAHTNPDGKTPSDRVMAAGYPVGAGENIAQAGTTLQLNQIQEVYDRHIALLRSPSHRTNIMSTSYSEVGTGIRYGVFTSGGTDFNSILVTENFSDRSLNYITGVAFTDGVASDNFYTVGEGVGGVLVTATNLATGQVFTETTGSSGGYALAVPNGVYNVVGTGGTIVGQVGHNSVQIAGSNVKVDFITTHGTPAEPVVTNGAGIVGLLDGQWIQASSTGVSFANEIWGSWSTGVRWEDVVTGDFDGDGDQDIAGRANGRWWVARSNGDSFVNESWGNWSTRVNWTSVMTGDFNGDGRDDIVGRINSGAWWVAVS